MSKVKIEVFKKETALSDGNVICTKRIAYRCPKCGKSMSKYFKFCPYCGEPIEFDEGEKQ